MSDIKEEAEISCLLQLDNNNISVQSKATMPTELYYPGEVVSNCTKDLFKTDNTKEQNEERKWGVIIIKKYLPHLNYSNSEIAKLLNIPTSANVLRIWKLYLQRNNPSNQHNQVGRPKEKLHPQIARAISVYIDKANERAAMPLKRDILAHLRELGMPLHKAILKRYLHRLGYVFKTIRPQYIDKYKECVQENKRKYLTRIQENRRLEGKEEVYIDESFINETHSRNNCWIKRNEPAKVIRPLSHSTARVCVIAGISKDGWCGVNYKTLVEDLILSEKEGVFHSGSIKYFKVSNNPEEQDYHSNFSKQTFLDYFHHLLLPSLITPALLIMDRCTYHTMLPEDVFNPRKSRKSELQEWLTMKGIEFHSTMKVLQLKMLAIDQLQEKQKTALEIASEKEGHSVLFLPQYHPELNPIELAWSALKGPIADQPTYKTGDILRKQLPNSFAALDSQHASRIFLHVEKQLQTSINEINNLQNAPNLDHFLKDTGPMQIP